MNAPVLLINVLYVFQTLIDPLLQIAIVIMGGMTMDTLYAHVLIKENFLFKL